jgi:hypothetical protein
MGTLSLWTPSGSTGSKSSQRHVRKSSPISAPTEDTPRLWRMSKSSLLKRGPRAKTRRLSRAGGYPASHGPLPRGSGYASSLRRA